MLSVRPTSLAVIHYYFVGGYKALCAATTRALKYVMDKPRLFNFRAGKAHSEIAVDAAGRL
jgi:hypothetical protein